MQHYQKLSHVLDAFYGVELMMHSIHHKIIETMRKCVPKRKERQGE